jgi:dTDP-glucose 4,6-dehydratase
LGLARVKKARILIASTSKSTAIRWCIRKPKYYGNVNTIGSAVCMMKPSDSRNPSRWLITPFMALKPELSGFSTPMARMRLNDGRVIPAFIGQALRGEDLTIFGDGSQTRSFCYVDDQVEGIYRLLHSDYVYPVNIGNPDEITIRDFAEEIIKLTGTTQKIVYRPLPMNDPLQRQPDTTRAREFWVGGQSFSKKA